MKPIERLCRQGLDLNRSIAMVTRFIRGGAINMIDRNAPASIGFALDARASAPHRLETAHMRFGKRLGRGWIVTQMQIDRIPPLIGGSYLGGDAISLTDMQTAGGHANDRAFRHRRDRIASAEIDLVSVTIDTIDNEEVTVAMLVGEAARNHAALSIGIAPGRRRPAAATGGRCARRSFRSDNGRAASRW